MVLWLHLSGGLAAVHDDVKVEEGRVLVHRGKASCNLSLSDDDRERLAAALRNIRPDNWKEKYLDATCRDCQVRSLQVGDRTVVWDDASEGKVPKDARAVAAALQDLMSCQ